VALLLLLLLLDCARIEALKCGEARGGETGTAAVVRTLADLSCCFALGW